MTILDLAERLESTAEIIRTPSGDGQMIWRQWGAGDPLILLHGGSGAWTHWLMNIEGLSEHYRLLAADIPGLGDSDDPPFFFDPKDYQTSVPKLAEVISLGITDILGNTAFHLCGFSFGSIVGSYVAANSGTRLLTFTLVGASAFGWPWAGLKKPFLSMSSKMSEAQRLGVQRANLANAMLESDVNDDLARIQLNNVIRARLRSHLITSTNVLIPGLSAVEGALNGIWGSADIFAQPNLDRIERLLKTLDSKSQFEIIKGAGHWVMFDAPERFNTQLLRILKLRT